MVGWWVLGEGGINKEWEENGWGDRGKYGGEGEGFGLVLGYVVFVFERVEWFLGMEVVVVIVGEEKMKGFLMGGCDSVLFWFWY